MKIEVVIEPNELSTSTTTKDVDAIIRSSITAVVALYCVQQFTTVNLIYFIFINS